MNRGWSSSLGEGMTNRQYEYGNLRKSSSVAAQRLKDLLLKSENHFCADCGAPDPKWASSNIGVFICLKCCGVHRSLGTHISKVLSVTLDEWSDEEIDSMIEVGGNSSANAIYEALIPKERKKPVPDSNYEERSNFIRSKYEFQEFLKPSLRIVSLNSGKSSFQVTDSRDIGRCTSTSSQKLKVQTAVIKSNLNPVWNEELMLSVPEKYCPLKLQVYDHDTFSADDLMGEAEVDIQPLITAAMALGNAEMFKDMPIGKWLKSQDNALMEDSVINIIGGKIKQEILLRLQKVESGELDVELEYITLNQ